jgi:hypothetical protein
LIHLIAHHQMSFAFLISECCEIIEEYNESNKPKESITERDTNNIELLWESRDIAR